MFDTIAEAQSLVAETFKKFGDAFLADKITISFNPRLTSCMGHARYSNKTIELSLPLWRRATTKQRRNLIIHEACHIFAAYKCGENIQHHGAEWRYFMCKAGLEPQVRHDVEPLNRFYMRCECGTNACSKRTIDRLMAEELTSCETCHTKLFFISDIAGLNKDKALIKAA